MSCHQPQLSSPDTTAIYPVIPDNNEALGKELTRLAGHINAANYRFLKLLAALVEREAWGGHGLKSPAHWLNYYCGISLGPAREKVRVALSLKALPLIDAAFSSGALSYSKVRALTRAATPQTDAYWLNIAKHGTASHVEKLVRQYQYAERLNSAEHAQAQQQARELNWYYDDDGMLVVRGRLAPAEGAAFVQAMQAVLDQNAAKNVSAETSLPDVELEDSAVEQNAKSITAGAAKPDWPQQRADALLHMAEHFLATAADGPEAQTGGDKYQVIIHLQQTGTITDDTKASTTITPHLSGFQASIDNGPVLAPTTIRRLLEDVSLVTVLEDGEGKVLNVGRKARSIPPAIRRALTLRDKGCRFPGCCEARHVDAHHIQHWCDGGETSLENLVLLCRRHHRLLHEEGYRIETDDPGNTVFIRAQAQGLKTALYPQFALEDVSAETFLDREHQALGLDIDERTAITAWQGERLDKAMAVEALMGMR